MPRSPEPGTPPHSDDAAREDSERSLRLLIESVQDYAIFSLDRNGFITSWNLGAQRIKGYTASEAIGRHFSLFYPQSAIDRGWPEEELRRAAADGRFEDEGPRLRKDGSPFWANVVITALRAENGELLGFSKVTRDLTERRRHEQQLQEREENLRLLVESVRGHAMFLLDASGLVADWNVGARRLFGYDAEQVVGQDASMLYTPEDRAAGKAVGELASARLAGYVRDEGWRQRADGSRFWCELTMTLLRDGDGDVRGYVQIVRDMSERRRVEALEDEGRRISEFIAMLSHELRNPLAPIRNAMAILKRLVDRPEATWGVELVERQVGHMSRLIDDLLDVSRVTSGKIRLDLQPLDLNALVQMAVDSARATLRGYGHAVSVQLAPRPVPLMADSTRLTQVIVNLLNNAAKYTPPRGHVAVSVREEAGVATLEVTDDGIGMGEALLQRAFEPFVQGQRALDRSEGGLGIGLTLVKRITELHGGSVSAASAGPGMGTSITVTLPITQAVADAPAQERAAAAAPVQGKRVLVVDDNKDAAESVAMLLGMLGHEVKAAFTGAQALELAQAFGPEIVLLDLGLPEMDGYEVARRLRRLPGLAQTRLVALTGYGQEQDLQASALAGFARHLVKPVDPELLASAVA